MTLFKKTIASSKIHIIALICFILALSNAFAMPDNKNKKQGKATKQLLTKLKEKSEGIIKQDSIKQAKIDSIWARRDHKAICFYDSVKSKSDKYFITRHLTNLFIVDKDTLDKKKKLNVNSAEYYLKFKDRQIRNIQIIYKDIFAINKDKDGTPSKVLDFINDAHVNTKESTVRRNIFFKEGEPLNPILMANSEEHLRELPYINRVNILCVENKDEPETVDVILYIQDNFSYGAMVNISSSVEGSAKVYNQNLFGLGHKFSLKYIYNTQKKQKSGYDIEYNARNLFSSFIDLGVNYANSYEMDMYDIQLYKPFVSSKEQIATEFRYKRILKSNEIKIIQGDTLQVHQQNEYIDSWIAKSINLKTTLMKSHQLILGARFSSLEQFQNPSDDLNYNMLYPTKQQLLLSLAFSKRKSYRANLIYGYGITEDIPIGRYFEFVAGYDNPYNDKRLYAHTFFSQSFKMKDKSYLYFDAFVGGFWNNESIEQAEIGMDINYFSKLYTISRYRFRQFINFNYTKGFNRLPYEFVSLNNSENIRDMNSQEVYGKEKVSIQLETVHYHKRAILGFRFASYIFCDFGAIENESPAARYKYDMYTEVGLGVRMRNESLVFNTIELRLGYFPVAPNDMNNFIYKALSTKTATFKDFRGRKPEVLPLK
ncbi:hypothetical protein K4L44_01440 [Halosquirtibacter laminarini]|uniref:Uncharacterized protein n=1 Tax=Halosquirtibacter laminarini TaxID=3374600 RepID=A0AC61NG05_9BACT|nr:hypothetical protein K4L44_01440 [Prolixibacteraceae bacterium]